MVKPRRKAVKSCVQGFREYLSVFIAVNKVYGFTSRFAVDLKKGYCGSFLNFTFAKKQTAAVWCVPALRVPYTALGCAAGEAGQDR